MILPTTNIVAKSNGIIGRGSWRMLELLFRGRQSIFTPPVYWLAVAKIAAPATSKRMPNSLKAVTASPIKNPAITAIAMLPPIMMGPPIVTGSPFEYA